MGGGGGGSPQVAGSVDPPFTPTRPHILVSKSAGSITLAGISDSELNQVAYDAITEITFPEVIVGSHGEEDREYAHPTSTLQPSIGLPGVSASWTGEMIGERVDARDSDNIQVYPVTGTANVQYDPGTLSLAIGVTDGGTYIWDIPTTPGWE